MLALLYCIGLVLTGTGLLLALTGTVPWMPGAEVKKELVKVGIQVIVFGIVGGGIKLLLDRQAAHRRFRADMLDRLGRAHKEVYRIRRLMLGSTADARNQLLGQLMDARQDLGAAYHVARVWGLGQMISDVQDETLAMRRYLEAVISSALASPDSPERAHYSDFLNWRNSNGTYETEFKSHYIRAKRLVDPSFRGTVGAV